MSKFPIISFVKQNDNNCVKSDTNLNDLDGNQIKEFYENVISSNDPFNEEIKSQLSRRSHKKVVKKIEPKSDPQIPPKNIKLESIFKFCQNGDLEECLQWIQMGFDVNTRDQYQWTPLMCSSCAGHQNIVELFLQKRADTEAKDKRERTAYDLALINGHNSICQLISEHKKTQNCVKSKRKRKTDEKVSEINEIEVKRCDVCHYEYNEYHERHNCSIVHQICLKTDRKFNKYFEISESNKGFQMMLRSGWTRDRGLGPQGLGMTAPIKTVLKRDRKGLGIDRNRPKVTHFESFDEQSVKQNKTSKDIERKRMENRLKRIEIKFRQDFK